MIPASLNAQIKDTQQRLLNRQRKIDSLTITLVQKSQQQMIAPATLLLACGIGFILGELTQCCYRSSGTQTSDTSPLKKALNLLAVARTLYPVLSLAWMMQSRHQSGTSSQKHEQKTRTTC